MFRNYGLIAAFLFALTGCGGGGGGGDSADTPDVPVVQPSSLVTTVSQPTYGTTTEEWAAFNLINAERDRCGLGKLAQSTAADTATAGHSLWNVTNGYTGHFQTPNTTAFTGVSPFDRLVASGYGSSGSFQANESIFARTSTDPAGMGVTGTRLLLNAPYHAIVMLDGYRDVGIKILSSNDVPGAASPQVTVGYKFAYKYDQGAQLLAGDAVSTYPCEGTTGVSRQLTNESPNPVPGRNLAQQPLGSSIMVLIRQGQTLNITSATLTNLTTGTAVTLRSPATSATDPNNALQSHQAFVSADAPLDALTQYQATISGTNNGTPFSRTFTFTTGS